MSDDFLQELTDDFVEQVSYALDECEEAFLSLESSENPGEELTQIFRLAHSIKGGSAVLGYDDLSQFAHKVEDLLSILRTYPDSVEPDIVSSLLISVDKFKERIEHIRNGDHDAEWDTSEIAQTVSNHTKNLEALYGIDSVPETKAEKIQMAAQAEIDKADTETNSGPLATDDMSSEESVTNRKVEVLETSTDHQQPKTKASAVSTVKVDTRRIDSVLDLVGELVVIKSQLIQEVENEPGSHNKLVSLMDQLDGMVRDLYDRSLSMRMTSLKPLFVKVQRVLRDLSVRLDKPIDLQVSGEATEIDRTMIETLTDPLIHIARNAIDHGLENKSERAESGKRETASVVFRAYQEGGHVVIEFKDDGKGIHPEKVKQKAIENGVLDPETAEKMSDDEAVNLIFAPGFSTAAEITDVSGRGVGLDVVRTNIEKIKGGITVQSKVGEGTTFSISIPMTTAIIDGMIMVSNGISYILPINNVKELLQFSKVEATETAQRSEVIFSRGKYIPILDLREVLPVSELNKEQYRCKGSGHSVTDKTVVIVEHNNTEYSIVVDEVLGKGQFVIKSLGESFENCLGVTGGSIMGDGKVSLILDVNGIHKRYLLDKSRISSTATNTPQAVA
ncbi:MAG: hypothetical protein CL677_05300 [Bdellovibrionaceae bacterium]|nr:hypothetical protein [Pseudobdellovibrionaceae bacterium]|tara:strand:- start:17582 stop:19435 length:1854 start_codon:yes stop_codon:yes gene_type:complete